MRIATIVIANLLMLLLGGLVLAGGTRQSSSFISYDSGDLFLPPYLSDADRMGFGQASSHDASIFNAGWYVDWGANANPAHPGGAEYARTIYLSIHDTGAICRGYQAPATKASQVTANLSGMALIENVQANPGALWIIGNEPDSIYNGSPLKAELYAELYHDYYTTIKSVDPQAKVAIGAIVQPSPLRMDYLDKILDHYQNAYGQALPTDLWNIHLYALREALCGTGAGIPPYSDKSLGWYGEYNEDEFDQWSGESVDVGVMQNNLRAFRQWMHKRGYGDKPLIITEFGVLWPPYYEGFDNSVVARYLNDVFTMFLSAADPAIGLTADDNRLVQMWAWFATNQFYGGDLFCGTNNGDDPACESGNDLTTIGQAFLSQTNTHNTPYVDLQPIPPTTAMMDTEALTVSAYIQNRGNTAAVNPLVAFSLSDSANGATVAEEISALGQIGKRYAEPPTFIQQTWRISSADPVSITHLYTLSVAPASPNTGAVDHTLAYQVNWRPLIDLDTANITFSSGPSFLYQEPLTVAATVTLSNRGAQPAPQTTLDLILSSPEVKSRSFAEELLVPPLAPYSQVSFTTSFSVSQVGLFSLSAVLPSPVDEAELYTANNHYTATLLAAKSVTYLPLIFNEAR